MLKSYRVLIGVGEKYIVGATGVSKEEARAIETVVRQNPNADVKIVREVA